MGTTTDPPCFPLDYASSRREFHEACARLGCALEAHPMNQAGPNGDDLTIDVAILPGGSPDRTLLVSSGIHGVEGFFGAAVQLRALQDWASRPGRKHAGVRCVMVHALNPFGFAWRRRVNEDNVDLNRNLLLPGESFSGSPAGYAALDGLLNPRHVPSRWEPVRLEFMVAIARHGMPAIKQSVASGQYDFPHGLFYGGGQPSRTSEILSEHFDRWLADSQRVFHLDLHTGLGKWGSHKLLIDHPISPDGWTTSLPGHLDAQAIIALYADHGTHEQFHAEFKTDLDLCRRPSGAHGPLARSRVQRATQTGLDGLEAQAEELLGICKVAREHGRRNQERFPSQAFEHSPVDLYLA